MRFLNLGIPGVWLVARLVYNYHFLVCSPGLPSWLLLLDIINDKYLMDEFTWDSLNGLLERLRPPLAGRRG